MANKGGVGIWLTILMISVISSNFAGRVEGYKNYTVGESVGWYDTSKVDYQKWASNKVFSLGDFLLFNTDNNHSVIQTYNATTYKLCDSSDGLDNDTIEWSSADTSFTTPRPVSVPVPLVKVGMTYFFSSDYDGEQCQNGQHLMINVTYGQGLPRSLKSPSDDSPGPVGPQAGDDNDSAPDTLVPSNFDNPRGSSASDDTDETDQPSGSVSLSAFSKLMHGLMLIVVGFLCF